MSRVDTADGDAAYDAIERARDTIHAHLREFVGATTVPEALVRDLLTAVSERNLNIIRDTVFREGAEAFRAELGSFDYHPQSCGMHNPYELLAQLPASPVVAAVQWEGVPGPVLRLLAGPDGRTFGFGHGRGASTVFGSARGDVEVFHGQWVALHKDGQVSVRDDMPPGIDA